MQQFLKPGYMFLLTAEIIRHTYVDSMWYLESNKMVENVIFMAFNNAKVGWAW